MSDKILIDLSPAIFSKYSGIARDSVNIFNCLSGIADLDTDGFFFSSAYQAIGKYKNYSDKQKQILQSADFWHDALLPNFNLRELIHNNQWLALGQLSIKLLLQKKLHLFKVPTEHFDVVWRNVFMPFLLSEQKTTAEKARFFYSNLTYYHNIFMGYTKYKYRLQTEGFQFVLFSQPTPTKISPCSIKLVRFHDNFPISEPDCSKKNYYDYYKRALNICSKDSFFICNSETSRNELLSMYPDLSDSSEVIPCTLNKQQATSQSNLDVKTIIKEYSVDKIDLNADNIGEYYISVGTIEPRKNYVTLIEGWRKFCLEQEKEIKLIIVGAQGWNNAEILSYMQQHIAKQQLFYLANIDDNCLHTLYAQAQAYINASFAEGFGYPPLEAMQNGCQLILSDITINHEIYGDNAYYFDPYSADSLHKTLTLYSLETNQPKTLIADNCERFLSNNTAKNWQQLLNKLKES